MKLKFLFTISGLFSAIFLYAETIKFTPESNLTEILEKTENAEIGRYPDGSESQLRLESILSSKDYLRLSGANNSFVFKKEFKVIPAVKYCLVISAKQPDGDFIRENNIRVPEMQTQTSGLLPSWETVFYDKDGKEISRRNYRTMSFASRYENYSDVFYAPANAAKMKLLIKLNKLGKSLEINQISFDKCPDEKAINCNPEFKHGYSGWNGFLRGSLLMNDKTGPVFDTAYGSGGEVFPLPGKGTYKLFGRAETWGGYSVINFEQRDKDNKIIKTVSVRAKPEGNSIEFALEPNAVYGRFNVYNHLLREVRLTREKE